MVATFIFVLSSVTFADGPRSMQAMRERIDQHLARHWESRDIQPAPPCTDSEFLRRAYLDLIGRVPRVSEVREYLDTNNQIGVRT